MPANKVTSDTQQAEYKGEPLDDELANGPMTKRSCRDPLCCLLFIAFVGGMIGISIYGYANGNPNLIGRGYDSDGYMCGVDTGYTDYPYLYFPVPFSGYLSKTLCVAACPATPFAAGLTCKTNTAFTDCTYDFTTDADIGTASGTTIAANIIFGYQTTAYVHRLCLPDLSAVTDAAAYTALFGSVSSTILDSDVLENWVSDIRETWPVIAVSIGVAFIIGFVYMILLRYCSGVLTWLAIIAFIAGMGILGWRFYASAVELANETTSSGASTDSNTTTTVRMEKAIAYTCWAVCGFTVLAVLCLWNRIRLAIAIMKAAADYVKATPSVFFVPPVFLFFLLIFFVFWGGAAIFLVSAGDATQIKNYPFGTFNFDKKLQRLLIYHLFALLWINAFFIASIQFVLASSTALWYFSQGTGQAAPKSIRTSVYRLFRYHLGSIAFGSLILAIIQMVRIILAYMEVQAKKMAGKESKIIQYTLKCLQCYVACFERFIKFLNKNAYIQIALTGKSFCGAAKDAFFLILRNPLRMGVVASIGSIFVLFGKIFIAALTALGAFLTVTNWTYFSEKLYSPFIPTLVVFFFAYVVGALFMSVYGYAADTILACFIVDEELNKKKNAPPRHCPASLRSFLDEHKKN
jgi:hypothetical protein